MITVLLLAALCWPGTQGGPAGHQPAESSKLCSSSNCRLPQCFCAGRRGPPNMQTHDIPQIVMLTFDDAVNSQNIDYYRELLDGERKNPNGCPISATFFVSHDWTDYKFVKELYLAGHEIADHSVSHRLPHKWWREATYRDWEEELKDQRRNIANQAGVPKFEVRGVRVPFLEIGGDTQFEVMADEGFVYDSSFLSGPYNERDWRLPSWPYTLEFAPELEYCDNSNCPKANFSGIWEVPLNRWLGLDGQACPMVDGCSTQVLKDKNDALRYLWKNFNRHYGKNRAPFGINLHAVWFDDEFKLEALSEFIDGILDLHDVYMVSVHDTVEWMRNPTTLSAISQFQPWLECSNNRVLVQRRKGSSSKSGSRSHSESEEDLPKKKKKVRRIKKVRESDESQSDDSEENVEDSRPRGRIVQKKKFKKSKPHSRMTSNKHDEEKEEEKDKRNNIVNDSENGDVNNGNTKKNQGEDPKSKKKIKVKGNISKSTKVGTQTRRASLDKNGSPSIFKSTIIGTVVNICLGIFLSL